MRTPTIPKRFGQFGRIAAKYSTRYAIDGVNVEHNGTFRLTATDGKRLVRATFPKSEGGQSEGCHGSAIVNGKQFKAAMKSDSRIEAETPGGDVANVGRASFHDSQGNVSRADIVVGKFPDCDAVAPTGEPLASVNVNAKLLAELLDVVNKAGGGTDGAKDTTVTLKLYGNKPIVIEARNTADGVEVFGLIMPIHLRD